MLAAAIQAHESTKDLVLVVTSPNSVQELRERVKDYPRIRVLTAERAHLDWESMTSSHDKFEMAPTFVDHIAIEHHFNLMLRELRRYDQPTMEQRLAAAGCVRDADTKETT